MASCLLLGLLLYNSVGSSSSFFFPDHFRRHPRTRLQEPVTSPIDRQITNRLLVPTTAPGTPSTTTGAYKLCERGLYTCVPYSHCTENGIVSDQLDFLGARIGRRHFEREFHALRHSDCISYGDVCCSVTSLAPASSTTQLMGDSQTRLSIPKKVIRCERETSVCVPFSRCNEDNIVSDQLDLLGVRISREQFEKEFRAIRHSECTTHGDVCCLAPNPEPTVPPTEEPESSQTILPMLDSLTLCERETYVCVSFSHCAEENIVSDQLDLLGIRIGREQFEKDLNAIKHSDCINYGDVCCSKPMFEKLYPPKKRPGRACKKPQKISDNDSGDTSMGISSTPDLSLAKTPRLCERGSHVCVPYSQCPENEIVSDQLDLLGVRISREQFNREFRAIRHSECTAYGEVCCSIPRFASQHLPNRQPEVSATDLTRPEKPSRCERGSYECVTYSLCAEENIVSDQLDLLGPRIGREQFEREFLAIRHSECVTYGDVCCSDPRPEQIPPPVNNMLGDCEIEQMPSPKVVPRRCEKGLFSCVPFSLCHEEHIVSDHPTSSNSRSSVLRHSECSTYGEVCCTTPLAQQPSLPTIHPPYQPRCGRINGPTDIGYDRKEAVFGEFPWMAAVLKKERNHSVAEYSFLGSGSLISDRIVITAAHLVYPLTDSGQVLTVRLGEWDTQHDTEPRRNVDVTVVNTLVHPDYDVRRRRDDVALLVLERAVTLQPHIDTLCLPQPEVNYDRAECVVAGWGRSAFTAGADGVVLRSVVLPNVPRPACQRALRTTRLRKYFYLDRSFTCAGGRTHLDTCVGDHGSALACHHPRGSDSWALVGVFSRSVECGVVGVPEVYSDTRRHLHWINEWIQRTA